MITKKQVLQLLHDGETHRKQFSANSGVQKNKPRPTFSVKFDSGLCKHFHSGTNLTLRWNEQYQAHYCFLTDPGTIQMVENWEATQGTRVFLRNLMTSSVALDVNFEDNSSRQKTRLGLLEEQAKHHQDNGAISELIRMASETVSSICYLRDCDYVMGIPAMADKGFDLPRELTRGVAVNTAKADLTPAWKLTGKAGSAKAVGLAEKWDLWANCTSDYAGPSLKGRRVILIDDKYQSGITIQFWASKLLEMGATEVHGLSMVKTLRDTDNQ
jgi:hypothetical protein